PTIHRPQRLPLFPYTTLFRSGILLGLAPALGSTDVDPGLALKAGSAGFGARRRSVFGKGLVIVQVALSLLLITAAGLLVRTFWKDRKSTRLNSSHEWISYAVF